jgi:hypothetical protein
VRRGETRECVRFAPECAAPRLVAPRDRGLVSGRWDYGAVGNWLAVENW